APEAPGRAGTDRREERARRRLVEEALPVALPARSGLRPPAVPAVSRSLAGVLAEGQDRRLARDVRARDGARLLELRRVPQRATGRGRLGSARGEGGEGEGAQAAPPGTRVGHVRFSFQAADQ